MAKVINRYSKKIGCLPQILLGPVLNKNSLIKTSIHTQYIKKDKIRSRQVSWVNCLRPVTVFTIPLRLPNDIMRVQHFKIKTICQTNPRIAWWFFRFYKNLFDFLSIYYFCLQKIQQKRFFNEALFLRLKSQVLRYLHYRNIKVSYIEDNFPQTGSFELEMNRERIYVLSPLAIPL